LETQHGQSIYAIEKERANQYFELLEKKIY